ncbi:hypothetical protein ACHAWX_003552 [Stephanocyclus meneghinianus]
MTPKGQMSGNGSGPAIMMMPPHIRATFMPNPPLRHLPPFQRHILQCENYITDDEEDAAPIRPKPKSTGPSGVPLIPTSFPPKKRGVGITGVASFLQHFERTAPPPRRINPTPKSIREAKRKASRAANETRLAPLVEAYRIEQRTCGGEHPVSGMNCYNTLFVGRLAYEVTERKLLREMEAFGPVKDLKLITWRGKSRGYAFVEYEHEEDMKRAYRAADGMRLEGRAIVVDVERGHTVPNWLPRRFGGGLGGTRLGARDQNVFMAGRYDPTKTTAGPTPDMMPPNPVNGGPPVGMMNAPPPPHFNGPPPGYGRFDDRGGPPMPPPPSYGGRRFDDRGPPPPPMPRYDRGPPPVAWERGGYDDRKRRRSRSPDRDRRRGRY